MTYLFPVNSSSSENRIVKIGVNKKICSSKYSTNNKQISLPCTEITITLFSQTGKMFQHIKLVAK